MRFDDSLATVLAADSAPGMGAEVAWRQLVDLVGRGRVPDIAAAIERLRGLRDRVPTPVRAASARALAWSAPPAPLVALFARDEIDVAGPVLRSASLPADEWLALLPALTPATRSILRHRRDLPAAVVRGLQSFGSTDFVLGCDTPAAEMPVEPVHDLTTPTDTPFWLSPGTAAAKTLVEPAPAVPASAPPTVPADTPFVPVGEIARALPVVAEAMRQAAEPPRSDIADLVARIEAFRRDKPLPMPAAPKAAPEAPLDRFRLETDAAGVIRWVEGVARAPLIGVTLAHVGAQGLAQIDAVAGGALRTRSAFRDARLELKGRSPAAGSWRLAAVPQFDRATGRFTGFAGVARRATEPKPVESASDSLRQLVHELRTPANAIAGFAELIESALLGPVPPVYRERALLIGREAAGLVAAIDDLDTAARLDGDALDLRPATVDVSALLARVVRDLDAEEHGATLVLDAEPGAHARADDRTVERLLQRLLATLLAVAAPGERLRLQLASKTRTVRLHVTRPRALMTAGDDALLALDDEAEREGGPLLGVGFTLRLVRNLATALGGSLTIAPERLTLRLPAAHAAEMERAATH